MIKVEWGLSNNAFPVTIQLEALDRVGLVRDISTLIAEEKINITNLSVMERQDTSALISLTVETTGLSQLSRLMSKLDGVKGVTSVSRVGDEATAK